MTISELFRRIVAALDQAGIAYMVTGSFASTYYGTPRSTQDLDIVIAPTSEQLRSLTTFLLKGDYYVDLGAAMEAHKRESMFNAIDMLAGWKVDFIICKSRPFSQEEFRRRTELELHGTKLFVASAEDVIVAKLEWARLSGSQRQIEDVAQILRARRQSLDHFYIDKWTHELGLTEEWHEAKQSADLS